MDPQNRITIIILHTILILYQVLKISADNTLTFGAMVKPFVPLEAVTAFGLEVALKAAVAGNAALKAMIAADTKITIQRKDLLSLFWFTYLIGQNFGGQKVPKISNNADNFVR